MIDISGEPTGEVKEEPVKGFVLALATKWKEENPSPRWWQFWKNTKFVKKACKFMLDAVDALIVYVDDLIEGGPDKKATVVAALAALFDVVVKDLLPIWLKPFAAGIKQLVVYMMLALLVDFIVGKYRKGLWMMPQKGAINVETKNS